MAGKARGLGKIAPGHNNLNPVLEKQASQPAAKHAIAAENKNFHDGNADLKRRETLPWQTALALCIFLRLCALA